MNYPTNWNTTKVGDSLDLVNGRVFKSSEWSTRGRPIIRIQNLNNTKATFNYYEGNLPEKFSVAPGDLLFAWSGTPGTSFGAHIWKGDQGWLNQHIFNIRFDDKLFDRKFLQLAINQNLIQYIDVAHGGAGLAHITKGKFEASVLPLPTLHEQKKIVEKIEELFSEMDAGEASLRQARQQLSVYRQALLKQAFEGKLTASWRAQNPDLLESPDQLLARIQIERQDNYQQQLKEWEETISSWETNEQARRPSKPRKVPESLPLSAEQRSNLHKIPDSWKWVHPDALMSFAPSSIGIGPFGSNLKVSDYRNFGVPLVFVKNITREDFELEARFVSQEKAGELAAHTTEGGDLLITKMGDPPGDCAIYPIGSPKAIITADCLKFRVLDDYCERSFYSFFINSVSCRKQLGLITQGVAQKKISVDRFKSIGIPFCSLIEQQEIVRLLDEQFETIAQNEKEIDVALKRSEALRQSILKKAFSGQLVAQDPADEPAAELLERIRLKRDANDVTKRRSRKSLESLPLAPNSLGGKDLLPNHDVPATKPARETDFQAGIMAMAILSHQKTGQYLGHVKAEKIVHLCDVIGDLRLGRNPVKDPAGPNDFDQLRAVDFRAKKKNWFEVQKIGKGYRYNPGQNLEKLVQETEARLGPKLEVIRQLIDDLSCMERVDAELIATVHAAWNNLLLRGENPDEEAIVTEARENWHPDKLKIARHLFFDAIAWIEQNEFVPTGTGHLISPRQSAGKKKKP